MGNFFDAKFSLIHLPAFVLSGGICRNACAELLYLLKIMNAC